ncbi:hypothetical protein [Chitinophaga solisilvae]|uniref:Uncharacterized protein n=1 Tax=Chitinophaga solisilvae TaxID=1233460 RepID=A0A433WCD2_9BACT|nr:hypothetical protein [Chitinophaga solisilvae]NSL89625.1 hypothetical protein [Chitinophaga solisilvae]
MSKETINVLLDIHEQISAIPAIFREKVCVDCNWSLPTFYRKLRTKDKPNPHRKGEMIPALSNAEKQKIIEIMDEVYDSFRDNMEKYRR